MYFFCLALGLFILGSIVISSLRLGISPMPSSRKVRKALCKILPKEVKGTIYELGSGWGGVAFLLAKRYPEKRVVGYELSLIPYAVSKIYTLFAPNLTIRRKNFLSEDLSDAGLTYCYLYPGAMAKLGEKWTSGVLISNAFQLHNKTPNEKILLIDIFRSNLFIYNS